MNILHNWNKSKYFTNFSHNDLTQDNASNNHLKCFTEKESLLRNA